MNTQNLSTLQIHKLTQAQYDRELEVDNIDETAIYLTPKVETDLSKLETKDDASKKLIEAKEYADSIVKNKSDYDHNHNHLYDTKGSASNALNSANEYTDSAVNIMKNELLNGAGTAYDTLKELGDLIEENQNTIEVLESIATNKADEGHGHNNATETDAGFMSPDDKKTLKSLQGYNLGDMDGKTLEDLQNALDIWLTNNYYSVNASAYFKAGYDWKSLWNSKDTTSTITTGTIWTVSIIAKYTSKNYVRLRISTYESTVLYVDRSNGEWTKLHAIATTDELQDKSDIDHTHNTTHVPDTRNDNNTPIWYITNYPKQVITELKIPSTIGLSGQNYCKLTTYVQWSSKSGEYPSQEAIIKGRLYTRQGISDETWGDWKTNIDSENISSQSVASATRVTISDGGTDVERPIVVNNNASSSGQNLYTVPSVTANYSKGTVTASGGFIGKLSGNADTATRIDMVVSDNSDQPIIRVHTGSEQYGYTVQYTGTGDGNNNTLDLITDNQDSEEKIKAVSVKQDGTIIFNKAITVKDGITGNASTATTAEKLGSSTVGSSSQPIYLSSGKATKVTSVGTSYGGTGATTVAGARTNLNVYSKEEVDNIASGIKNELLNGAGTAYDTLKELGDLIDANVDTIEVLETVAANKAPKDHTHDYAGSSSAGGSANSAVKLDTSAAGDSNTPVYFDGGKPVACTGLDLDTTGNAATATKLKTSRKISLGTGATGTATSFNGSSNITIPVTDVKEAYLSWGGKNFAGSYGPIDAAMIPSLGANRLAFMPPAAVTVEYSIDGGSTWAEYSTNDSNKINLFNGNGYSYYIGASTKKEIDKSQYMLRVTIETSTANVYTTLNKIAIYCATDGSSGSYCTITARTQANYSSSTDTWNTVVENVSLIGWPGWNIINTSDMTTYGNTDSQYRQIRFTFGVTSHPSTSNNSGLRITRILGFGGMGHTTPSTMASHGRMYTYDSSQNVTFPAKLNATAFTGGPLEIDADEKDIHIWRVYDTNPGEYGFRVQYNGTGDGNNTTLQLIADNQTGTEIVAATVKQDGTITIPKAVTASTSVTTPTVKSSSTLDIISSSTTYFTRGVSASAIFKKGDTENARFDTSGNFIPGADSTYNIGSSSLAWKNIYADTFTGALSGNASTATKLKTSRTIDGVSFDGSDNITHYGTCSTAAATVEKAVACTGFTLAEGAKISVKFTVTNTASSPTLNVNSTGAKSIFYRGSAISKGYLAANRVYEFVYDGTNYELIGDINVNTTYTNASLGQGYGTCETAADTVAKVVTLSSYALTTGGIVSVKFTYDVPANATMNINSKGAKSIYHRGAAITSGVIKAGDIATFIYSTQYHLISIDRWQNDITDIQTELDGSIKSLSVSGKTITYTKNDGSTGTITTQDTNTTYSNFVKSGSGAKAGLVPAPSTTAGTTKYLREDGTWAVPPDTNSTYTLSSFGITATATELNILNGVTANATELNYVDGVTSNIQTQLNNKAPAYTYGTTDMIAGTSSLPTGTLYFVYT